MKTSVLTAMLSLVVALNQNDIEFDIQYFKYRNVKYVCVVVCEEKRIWTNLFAKYSTRLSIRVSAVFQDNFDQRKLLACTSHYLGDVGILLDANCPVYEDILYYASENLLLESTHKWLIKDSDTNETNIFNSTFSPKIIGTLKDLNVSVNVDLILSKATDIGYQMYEIYNYGKIQGGELMVKDLGVWNEEKGFSEELNGYIYYRRWNFQELPIRMVVVMTSSIETFEPTWLTGRRQVHGLANILRISGTVLNELSTIHNFKFTFTVVDRWIGNFDQNDSHMVAATAIYYKFQDITPVLRFNTDLISKLDLVHPPLTFIETRYYYRIPTNGPGKFENQFLRPLSSGVWLFVFLVGVLCGILLFLSAKTERRESSGQYAFFSVFASICQQYFEDNNDNGTGIASTARKLTIVVTGISCLLIYNYYTSSVVSWLLNGPPPSINSLQELLDSPLELIFEDIGYSRSWLKSPDYYFNKRNAEIETLLRQKKVLNKKNKNVLTDIDQGIAMVKAGGYAFHTEPDSANRLISETFTQEELCEMGSVQSMEKTALYAAVQKRSPFIEFLNWSLKRLMERGIVSCVQHRIRSSEVRCEGSSPRALALGGAAPAFLLLAAGYVLAFAIMLLERMAEQRKLLTLRQILR